MNIIDRRKNPKDKSLVNRRRLLERNKDAVREAVKRSIEKTDIKDISNAEGKVTIPSKGIKEPRFHTTKGGRTERVLPGNKEYSKGDTIPKPQGGAGGGGKKGSPDGDGEDDFQFTLTREEFLDIFFEDLELPDLVKTNMKQIQSFEFKHGGYTTVGNPCALNVKQTMRQALGRRIALKRPKSAEVKELEEELFGIEKKSRKTKADKERIDEIRDLLKKKKGRMSAIPFIDPIDVRYDLNIPNPIPSTQAVMFCLMDVSGSMGEREKDLAKRFFMLLHLFLERQYEKIDVVFIRHTHTAQEVDEETFFYDRQSGGTTVSTCLTLMDEIIKERYPTNEWNIYAAQASDGENWSDSDSQKCVDILETNLLPVTQYFAYIEILDRGANPLFDEGGELWEFYQKIVKDHFKMKKIAAPSDIFPVFRELFTKDA